MLAITMHMCIYVYVVHVEYICRYTLHAQHRYCTLYIQCCHCMVLCYLQACRHKVLNEIGMALCMDKFQVMNAQLGMRPGLET